MSKRACFLLLVLWLAFQAIASAYYDPHTQSFLSRDPIREAGGVNLYAYCANDPIGHFDPIGLQMPGSYYGWPVTNQDAQRALAIYGLQQTGQFSPAQIENMTNQSEQMNQMGRDGMKILVGMEITGAGIATGGAGPGLVGVLGDAAMASGGAMLQQSANNVIDGYPWSQGVPQAGTFGAVFGAGGSAVSRLATGAFAGRISLQLPRFFRTSRSPLGFGELPLGYQGGPGAMWIGENLGNSAYAGARTWQEYQNAVNALYGGEAVFSARQFTAIVDGKLVNGIADNVVEIAGRRIAVDSKFVENWATSLRNPSSPIGGRLFALDEQQKMLSQARAYSAAFDEIIYHSNSPELIEYYTGIFQAAGIPNFKFILTK